MLGSAVQKISHWSGAPSLVRVVARLLPSLQKVMADDLSGDKKLFRITRLIATELRSDVCSVYVLRAGDVLELFSTHGLRPEAVHVTRLRVGEGLVGTVAATGRAMNIKDAAQDPRFAYRPETGEEPYQGFCGVPLLRDGKVRGVLVVQSAKNQTFAPELVDMLATVAMLVTELLTGAAIVTRDEVIASGSASLEPLRVPGLSFHHGIAIGRAVRMVRKVVVQNFIGHDVAAETARFETALGKLQHSFDTLLQGTEKDTDSYDILETYRLFTVDRGWLRKIKDRLQQGLTAEAAVQAVQDDTTARLSRANDLYLKERVQDFLDVSQRMLHILTDQDDHTPASVSHAILVAHDISAVDLLQYDMSLVRGIALEAGSPSSHVTIMARAMGIPVIGQCKNLLERVDDGDSIILDADKAQLYIAPPLELLESYEARLLPDESDTVWPVPTNPTGPAISQDGIRIELHLNAGLLSHLPDIKQLGADGIGLYRTEVPFMALGRYPTVEEQSIIYAQVMMDSGKSPVIFRTLDIGSDKKLPYMPHLPEENPALGWRGIRIGLDRPALLRHQYRALLMAANGRPLKIMLPMVAAVGELQSARHTLDMECEHAIRRGIPLPASLELGVMMEVPSLMWQMKELAEEADFISIGSNDLFQYTYAVDRSASHLQGVFDPLCMGFLRMLREIVQTCAKSDTPLSLCGEMGGKPIEAMALIGLGFRSLSMSAPAIAGIKTMVGTLDVQKITDFMHQILDIAPPLDYRAALRAFARDHGVELGRLPQTLPPMVG